MKYVDEYRDREVVLGIAAKIRKISKSPVTLMEVCGGHTTAIHKFGLPSLLPPSIRLVSGPGCPVCVSSIAYIDKAIALSRMDGSIITTYGDLIRVPGSSSSLEKERANGSDIRIVYSVMDALTIARQNPDRSVLFPGIGFETTAPSTAAAISEARNERLKNFFVFSSHKIMPPVMEELIHEGIKINGYIAPGHVSAITGSAIYNDIAAKFGLGVVISGFEPADIMQSVYMLVRQFEEHAPKVEIAYKRVVRPDGNMIAKKLLNEVFEPRDEFWRGIGNISRSGLKIRDEFRAYDAEKNFDVPVEISIEPKGCICGEILKGLKSPGDCKLFSKVCHPGHPVGACMVSGEGACAAFYKFGQI